MNRWIPAAGVAIMAGGLIAGVAEISRQRLGEGDLYREYSSLRADPDGTKALFDGLAKLPGFTAERGLRPLVALEAQPPRLLLFAGMGEGEWREWDEETAGAIDRAVEAGSRAVIAFQTGSYSPPADSLAGAAPPAPVAAEKQWGANFEPAGAETGTEGAVREPDAPAELPSSLPWENGSAFELKAEAGWRILYRRDSRPVIVERTEGRGTLVLCADASFLTNDALANRRESALLAWLVGPMTRAYFDETHLGITEDNTGIAALGRRYGLTGAMLLLAGAAGLFIWRKMALFLPASEEAAVVALEYAPTAGLETLLRRSIPGRQLTAICLAEWHAAGRPGQVGAAAPAETAAEADPAEAYNARRAALRRRRNPSHD